MVVFPRIVRCLFTRLLVVVEIMWFKIIFLLKGSYVHRKIYIHIVYFSFSFSFSLCGCGHGFGTERGHGCGYIMYDIYVYLVNLHVKLDRGCLLE